MLDRKTGLYDVPAWAKSLRLQPSVRLSLGQLPTPLERWFPPGLKGGWSCWLKRDDRSGAALSGNKIRKLEFLLADALAQGCDTVITCGGIQSNHCRATATAARQVGLDSVLLLRTQNTEEHPGLTGNLLLDFLVGAKIRLITPAQYNERSELMEQVAEELRERGRVPYIVPEGGSNALGSWGYLEAVRELGMQLASLGEEVDDIVFACGSGGTAAGLALGVALARLPIRVHAINVCDNADYFYDHVDRVLRELGSTYQARDILDIIDGYKGLGYAVSQTEELEMIRDVAHQTGVLLDPVYSGKAWYGLTQELQFHPERFRGKRLLFLHTGGLFGLYSKTEQLLPLLEAEQVRSLS